MRTRQVQRVQRGTRQFCSKTCYDVAKKGRLGNRAPCWKGGRYLTLKGYVLVYAPDHPHAQKKGYVLEHILVA